MRKVFSIIGIILVVFLVAGCSCALFRSKTSPTRAVESFLGKYQSLDEEIMDQLDDVVIDEDLTSTQKDEYKAVMKRQYQNLTYIIKEEIIDGDNAIVTTEIEVYDFVKTQRDVDSYVEDHKTEFEDENGDFSQEKYMDYKLEQLKKEMSRVKYTIDFRLTKKDNEWELDDLTDTEREKIHGVYVTT